MYTFHESKEPHNEIVDMTLEEAIAAGLLKSDFNKRGEPRIGFSDSTMYDYNYVSMTPEEIELLKQCTMEKGGDRVLIIDGRIGSFSVKDTRRVGFGTGEHSEVLYIPRIMSSDNAAFLVYASGPTNYVERVTDNDNLDFTEHYLELESFGATIHEARRKKDDGTFEWIPLEEPITLDFNDNVLTIKGNLPNDLEIDCNIYGNSQDEYEEHLEGYEEIEQPISRLAVKDSFYSPIIRRGRSYSSEIGRKNDYQIYNAIRNLEKIVIDGDIDFSKVDIAGLASFRSAGNPNWSIDSATVKHSIPIEYLTRTASEIISSDNNETITQQDIGIVVESTELGEYQKAIAETREIVEEEITIEEPDSRNEGK